MVQMEIMVPMELMEQKESKVIVDKLVLLDLLEILEHQHLFHRLAKEIKDQSLSLSWEIEVTEVILE